MDQTEPKGRVVPMARHQEVSSKSASPPTIIAGDSNDHVGTFDCRSVIEMTVFERRLLVNVLVCDSIDGHFEI